MRVALGNEGATIQYRDATVVDQIQHKPHILVDLLIAVLTVVGAGIAGVNGFLASTGSQASQFAHQTAAVVLAIAFVKACWDLYMAFADDW